MNIRRFEEGNIHNKEMTRTKYQNVKGNTSYTFTSMVIIRHQIIHLCKKTMKKTRPGGAGIKPGQLTRLFALGTHGRGSLSNGHISRSWMLSICITQQTPARAPLSRASYRRVRRNSSKVEGGAFQLYSVMLSLLSLPADLLHRCLADCEFDALCALLATSQQISHLVPAVLQSQSWRAAPDNARALLMASWDPDRGSIDESCVGAFDEPITGLALSGSQVACFKGREVKVWDSKQARTIRTHAFTASHMVDSIRLRGQLLAMVTIERWSHSTVRVIDLGGDTSDLPDAGVVLARGGCHSIEWANDDPQDDALLVLLRHAPRRTLALWRVSSGPLAGSALGPALVGEKLGEKSGAIAIKGEMLGEITLEHEEALGWHGYRLLAKGTLAVVAIAPTTMQLVRLVPVLKSLRSLVLAHPPVALSGTYLAAAAPPHSDASPAQALPPWPSTRGAASGAVWLWRLDALLEAPETALHTSTLAGAPPPLLTLAAPFTSVPPIRLEPTRPEIDPEIDPYLNLEPPRPETVLRLPFTRSRRDTASVMRIAISEHLVAATLAGNRVFVWHVSADVRMAAGDALHQTAQRATRCLEFEPLCIIGLPSRQHSHFHPNIVVPNSLSGFGHCVALSEHRIALSAICHGGDWREVVHEADGDSYLPRSLVVVQEMGPLWWRA